MKERIKYFKESDNFWIALLRDFLSVLILFVMISSIFYITMGSFSPMVAVESGSMMPHIQIGDFIFFESADRTKIITYNEGKEMGYSTFDGSITKGDNPKTNSAYDQQGSISPQIPVKPEWVIGVARFDSIPMLGCFPLALRGTFPCFENR